MFCLRAFFKALACFALPLEETNITIYKMYGFSVFQIEKKISKMLGDLPKMQHAGSNVNLTITTDSLSLMVMESGEVSHVRVNGVRCSTVLQPYNGSHVSRSLKPLRHLHMYSMFKVLL